MDNKVTAEFIKTCPDPDPETEHEMEALNEEIGADDLLMMAMEGTCEGIYMVLDDTIQRPLDGVGICEAAARIRDLAEITLRMHDRLTMRSTMDKLRELKEISLRNEANIQKWREEHEQGAESE